MTLEVSNLFVVGIKFSQAAHEHFWKFWVFSALWFSHEENTLNNSVSIQKRKVIICLTILFAYIPYLI